jgi:hypothetical protein
MEDIVVYLAIGLLIAGGISSFVFRNFEEQFGRTLFHGLYVPVYIGLLLGIGGPWLGWVSIIALALLLIYHSKQYGIWWAVCAAGFTLIICITVIAAIKMISDFINGNNKKDKK